MWLVGAVCVAIGVVAGINPTYAILGALGIVFAAVTVMDLTLGFVLFAIATFLDQLRGSGSFSATKVLGLVVFLSWLATRGARRRADGGALLAENPRFVAALVGLLAWTALSYTWATSGSTALKGTITLALNVLLVPIGFSAIRKREHVQWVLGAIVLAAVGSSIYGLLSPNTSGLDIGRATGTIGEPNAEGTILAATIPLLICLLPAGKSSLRLRLATIAGVIVLFAGLAGTASREGLLSLAAVLVAAVIFGGRWRRKALALTLAGALFGLGYFVIVAPSATTQRVTMADTSGRFTLWTVATRVVSAHPLLGVGNDNFLVVEKQYINRPGAIKALYVVTTPKYTHNTFLEAAADLGIPGLILLLAVLGASIGALVRAAWIFERLGDRQMELMTRAVFLAFVAVLTSDFFVSNIYSKFQWLLIALCPALLALAQRAARRNATEQAAIGTH